MKLFSHVRQDTCPYCYTDKAIELYDKNDWTNSDRIPVPLSDGNMLNYIKHYSESRMT